MFKHLKMGIAILIIACKIAHDGYSVGDTDRGVHGTLRNFGEVGG